jgi:hypothetical protein
MPMHDGRVGPHSPPPQDDDDRRRAPDGAQGPHGPDPRPLTASGPLGVVVPDDLSGLEEEVQAVQAELGIDPRRWAPGWTGRRARFAAWLRRHAGVQTGLAPTSGSDLPPAGLGRSLLVGPIVAVTLLLVAGLVALFPPSAAQTSRRSSAPPRLATPAQEPGAVGGLLPDVRLTSATGSLPARSLRPAVLMLVPDGCACPDLVHQLIGQVEEYPGLAAALVASGADPAVLRLAVERDGGNGRLPALVDPGSTLARTYHGGAPGTAPTLLFVAGNGILTQPPLVFGPGSRIEGAILPLVPPRD